MTIKEIVNKYITQGHSYKNAQNLAAEEIILRKIATSSLSEQVTLKGGMVMFNITKNARRVTQDIDFDLIKYSIDHYSIMAFIGKMNSMNDGIEVSIIGNIEQLHQEDYRGVRVRLLLKDLKNSTLKIKLDIGVHKYTAIEQEKIIFTFGSDDKNIIIKVNPCEQIFAEKLLSLARLGPISTRYKDIYDLYYLVSKHLVDICKTRNILAMFFQKSKRKPNNLLELIGAITETLNNDSFAKEAKEPASKWIDIDYELLKCAIIEFIQKL